MTPMILVVEDDPTLCLFIEELLADEGYATRVWPSAKGAVDYIRQEVPDLVILDLWLEQRGAGWIILEQLRRDSATAHIPIIVCSGDTQTLQAQATSLDRLRCEVVEKPFDLQHLLDKVKQCVAPPQVDPDRSASDAVRPLAVPLLSSHVSVRCDVRPRHDRDRSGNRNGSAARFPISNGP